MPYEIPSKFQSGRVIRGYLIDKFDETVINGCVGFGLLIGRRGVCFGGQQRSPPSLLPLIKQPPHRKSLWLQLTLTFCSFRFHAPSRHFSRFFIETGVNVSLMALKVKPVLLIVVCVFIVSLKHDWMTVFWNGLKQFGVFWVLLNRSYLFHTLLERERNLL